MANVWMDVVQAHQKRESHRENAAGFGTFYSTFESRGTGDLVPSEPLKFDLPMFDEPAMTHGLILRQSPDRDYYALPLATAGVYRWQRNRRGFYVGAYLYFHVECRVHDSVLQELEAAGQDSSSLPVARPVLLHHFVFAGSSYKAMNDKVHEGVLDERLRTHEGGI